MAKLKIDSTALKHDKHGNKLSTVESNSISSEDLESAKEENNNDSDNQEVKPKLMPEVNKIDLNDDEDQQEG